MNKKIGVSLLTACLLLFSITTVLALDSPITIQTEPGNEVRLNVRMPDTGVSINSAQGIADEEGIFTKTFYSLNEPNVIYHVRVLSGLTIISDEKFEGFGISSPLFVDCLSGKCSMMVDTRPKTEETSEEKIVVENETKETNETNESAQAIVEETLESEEKEATITGNVIFDGKRDGQDYLFYGGAIVLVIIILAIIVLLIKKKKRSSNISTMQPKKDKPEDDDDEELAALTKRVNERAEEIKKLKAEKSRVQKIEEVKKKLAEEEQELARLKGIQQTQPQAPQQPQQNPQRYNPY